MKKQIGLYILWDVLFLTFTYAYSNISYYLKRHIERAMDIYPSLWGYTLMLLFCGGFFALLVLIGGRCERTVRCAVAEFIIIGLPSFYLATIMVLPATIAAVIGVESVRWFFPSWMFYSSAPITMGSILLGYELVMLVVRLVQIRKSPKPEAAGLRPAEGKIQD